MSELLSEFKLFENCDFKNDIKYYHVWDYYKEKCALFVTNDDKVYGININEWVITSSYRSVIKENENNEDLKKFKPIEIKELSDKKIKEFHFGWYFVLALSEENKLYSWGENDWGQLGRESEDNIDRNPTEIIYFTNSISNIKQICIDMYTVLVLLDNGKVFVWGKNERIGVMIEYLRLSNNGSKIREPFELYSLKEIEFIHMNRFGCFAIDRNYNVFTWGNNEYGQLGHESTLSFISEPKFSGILSKLKIITVEGNWNVTYLLSSDGKLYICGKDCENIETVNNSLNIIQLEKINDRFVVLSDNQTVFELKSNGMEETIYKSFEEYSRLKFEITFKTEILFRMKDFKIDLTELIGHGGFGRVYKVLFQQYFYAVKKILLNDDRKNYLDKNSEFKILQQLKSDFVVNLYDYWFDQDKEFIYIQMELCDKTLRDIIIEEKNVSIPPIIDYMIRTEIFRQLLEALNYLHSMTPKVIHRDIKPSNVLIKYHNDHAICKLCDFGLSKIFEKESSNTSYVGTSHYRAPEVATNKYNEKIDIFSLGISIRELFDYLMVVGINEYNLSRNLKNLKNIIITMIHGSPDQRPSAEKLLKKISKFSMDLNKRIELFTLIDKVRNENDYLPLRFLKLDLKSNNNCTVS